MSHKGSLGGTEPESELAFAQAELYANQTIDIADETPVTEQPAPDGGVTITIDSAGVQRDKLRVDARKWVAAKLLPRKYGERMLNEVRGNLESLFVVKLWTGSNVTT